MVYRPRPDLCGGRWETSVPTASDTMTGLLSASALLIGKPCVAAGLGAWPLPVSMLDRI